jgi:ATP-dependent Lon protease
MTQTIPLMTVRDCVIFPGTELTLQIGRPFTIASIKKALASKSGQLIVGTQRAIEQNEAPNLDQVFPTACLCRIDDFVEFPDTSMKINIIGESRFTVESLVDVEGVRHGSGTVSPWFDTGVSLDSQVKQKILEKVTHLYGEKHKQRVDALVAAANKTTSLSKFAALVSPVLYRSTAQSRPLTLDEIKQGVFLVDTFTSQEREKINVGLARLNELLSENSATKLLQKIETLLT